MKVVKVKDYEEASQKAFSIFRDQVKEKTNSVLGLATGSTPIRMYELLVEDHKMNGTSYKDIRTFNLDEYYGLEPTHPQSYYYFMMEHLFKYLDIDLNNVHVPKGNDDIQAECDRYTKLLRENTVDLQLLGIGSNGHIGFNEPGTSFESTTHYIELDESTRKDNARLFFNNVLEDVPTHAVTMGIKNIMEAKKVVLIACGVNKADAIRGLVEDEPTTALPASILSTHPDFTLIIDEAAASKLTK